MLVVADGKVLIDCGGRWMETVDVGNRRNPLDGAAGLVTRSDIWHGYPLV